MPLLELVVGNKPGAIKPTRTNKVWALMDDEGVLRDIYATQELAELARSKRGIPDMWHVCEFPILTQA